MFLNRNGRATASTGLFQTFISQKGKTTSEEFKKVMYELTLGFTFTNPLPSSRDIEQ